MTPGQRNKNKNAKRHRCGKRNCGRVRRASKMYNTGRLSKNGRDEKWQCNNCDE